MILGRCGEEMLGGTKTHLVTRGAWESYTRELKNRKDRISNYDRGTPAGRWVVF